MRELSRNQFSTIFDAEDLATPNQPQCQIEKLQPSYDSEVLGEKSWQKVSQTFVRQGNTLQKISHHPQIPQLLAFFECDRHFYLVREFIKGRTLAQKIEQSLIEEAEAIDWLQDILGILDFIHQAGIIHLNIQPSSLIEQYDGKRLLTNFSSVKNAVLFDHQSLETIANRDFVSPEQLEGKQNFNTDIYALGKTIIYALTGKVGNAIESNLSSDERLPITANIRPELAELLNKMVAENSAQRYESAAKVLEELDFGKQVVTLPPPMFADFRYPITDLNSKGKSQKRNSARELFKKPQKLIWLL